LAFAWKKPGIVTKYRMPINKLFKKFIL